MPTYEYRCQLCHEYTEAFQKMSDAPLTTCPHCGKEGLQRIVSGGAGVIYKGEGWYVTDYSKKSSGGKDIPKTESSTPSEKKETSSTDSTTATSDSTSKGSDPAPSKTSTGSKTD